MNSIICDVDGTLCEIKKSGELYSEVSPKTDVILKISELKRMGYKIVLYSSRGMRTYKGDIEEIERNVRPVMESWLKKHSVEYDELILGKPWPGPSGFYVDDRTIRPDELVRTNISELSKLI